MKIKPSLTVVVSGSPTQITVKLVIGFAMDAFTKVVLKKLK